MILSIASTLIINGIWTISINQNEVSEELCSKLEVSDNKLSGEYLSYSEYDYLSEKLTFKNIPTDSKDIRFDFSKIEGDHELFNVSFIISDTTFITSYQKSNLEYEIKQTITKKNDSLFMIKYRKKIMIHP